MSRATRDYRAFMFEGKRAPDIYNSQPALDAYSGISEHVQKVLLPTLSQNGFPRKNLVSPHFFFSDGTRLLTEGGYTRESVAAMLKTVGKGRGNPSIFAAGAGAQRR